MGYQNADGWQTSVSGMNSMMGTQGYTSSYQALALETVVTPAGTFPNALHVHERRGSGYERDVWYAPDVGVVRWKDGRKRRCWRCSPFLWSGPEGRPGVGVLPLGLDHYFVTPTPLR